MVMYKGRIVLDNSPEQVFSKVEWLKVLGLGVPGVTELMWQLQQRGENVRTNILTIDDACREISSLIRRSRSSAYANRPEVDKYV
ncbi:MAG: energy-coupling factor transporter ATPase, partial [Syntrophomonadaceae bacterium]|nr:energy-coupling factor transporter ATPase [Syntrophomonadaceae bacterium]